MSGKRSGFTLVELLVVISIISILSVIGITVFNGAREKAKTAKISADFDAIYKSVEIARIAQQKTLCQIIGTVTCCSECLPGGCRGQDAKNCLGVMTAAYALVTKAPLPLDPWGRPYTFDENEGEAGDADCRFDRIKSAGPDKTLSTGDDIRYYLPISNNTNCTSGIIQGDL